MNNTTNITLKELIQKVQNATDTYVCPICGREIQWSFTETSKEITSILANNKYNKFKSL